MRVIMLIDRYTPIWGGAENQLKQLIPHLQSSGIHCMVLTRRWTLSLSRTDTINSVDIVRVGIPGNNFLSTGFYILSASLYLLVNYRRWNIIHTHGAAALGILGVFIARLSKKNSVVKIATAGKIPRLQKIIFGTMLLKTLKSATSIISLSKEIENELTSISIDKNKMQNIYNGVDVKHFFPASVEEKRKIRKTLSMPDNAIVSLFCGRIVKRKGLDLILRIWKNIEDGHPDRYLYIAGDGNMQPDSNEAECRNYAHSIKLKNIVFLGETDKIRSILQAGDIFLFPSRREGFPNALLEAMAAGLAVIASDIGGVNELIQDNVSGLLFNKNDMPMLQQRLIELINSRQLRHNIGTAARKHVVASHSFEYISGQYNRLYRDLS